MKKKAAELLDRVRDTLHRHDMLEAGERCLAAVSGGPDSMCLAQALHDLRIPFEIAHFDHGTRAGESAQDAAFVREAAARYGVPCYDTRRDMPREAGQSPDSFEEVARRARYAFLLETASARGCQALATGHHADDQAETVLLRLLRGTSPGGLGAIPPVRQCDGVRIIRPLLDCTRDEILAYLEARNVPYREDRTNADTRHPRNRVRHELLPLLTRDYNPRVRDALRRVAEIQHDEDDFLEGLAADLAEAIVLDDLQWCDGPSLDLLDASLRALREMPWMVVAMLRPEAKGRQGVFGGQFTGATVGHPGRVGPVPGIDG